ncbi:V-type proton ATPase subunit H isoform X2 [Lepisosteus oculatus]|uniref:V-type proton ATPase subunit H isoform X2 n=1 Tax=Lepisosteus oculatus TaxID=7918 RepID=UPI00074006ED|nr:PREDICTED: V-type proton ATPase subunit H isoform X2 [Lepisosteus oculatus]
MDIRGAVDAAVPTNIIAAKAAEVRANKVNWQSYLQGQMISAEDCEFIKKFELARSEEKQVILSKEGNQCAKTFLNLMAHISKEQTVQYILTMIDDTLQENHQRVNIFFDYAKKTKNTAWSYFLPMLNRQDLFTVHMAARIIAKLAAWGRELMEGSDLNYYFNWIKTQLSSQSSQYVQCVAGCLQLMLRVNEYRFAWVEADGVNCITAVLNNKCGFQLQYQMIFCIWLLAFNPQMCEYLRRYNVVPALSDILQESVKEKVTRIILAAFRNLLEKSAERETRQEYALAMIQCKVLKQLENLDQQKYDDEDISDDIKFLLEKLGESVQDLSSFDEYSSELKSGRLEWSPVHKSEKFWRENAVRLNEKNYELLKILTRLLEVSDDPQVLAVAAHDVGEYVRHYPRGKRVIEQLGGKQLVMNHMHHEDQQVRYNALLAVQKLMVHNWEYLGKQLQSSEQPPAVAARS